MNNMETFDNTNWTVAYTTNETYKANILVEILEENGISAVQMNRKDSNFPFGEIDIMVNAADFDNAKSLIDKHIEL